MENFTAHTPTVVHFGKGVTGELGSVAKKTGKHALLMYGKGSVLKNGSYAETKAQLESAGIKITEYNGIKSNPLAIHVDEAAKTGIENKVDMVVAVGGGSVIDSAKITALCIYGGHKAWDIMKLKVMPKSAVPLLAVLTLAATGTEMNAVAVLQNQDTREKLGYRHPSIYPAHSFLDPSFTLSVPGDYTSYGITDLIAHCLEAYFGEGDASLADRFIYSIIHEAMEYGPALMNDLNNYDLRARIMWAATNALNGLTSYGKKNGDWGVHALGHILSFLYDTPHGASLSIVYPAWMRALKDRMPEKLSLLGANLFGNSDPDAAINGLESFFRNIESPVRLSEVGIGKDKHAEIIELMNRNRAGGMAYKLDDDDRRRMVELMA